LIMLNAIGLNRKDYRLGFGCSPPVFTA